LRVGRRVGQYIEGLAFSPDGNFLAVIPQNGSNLATNHPFYNDHGLLIVFAVKERQPAMSALPLRADINQCKWDGRSGPIGEMGYALALNGVLHSQQWSLYAPPSSAGCSLILSETEEAV
jgi:hypothetical protein